MKKGNKARGHIIGDVGRVRGLGLRKFLGRAGKYIRPILSDVLKGTASELAKKKLGKLARKAIQNSASALTQLSLNQARGGSETLNKSELPDEVLAVEEISALEDGDNLSGVEILKKGRKRKKKKKKKEKKKGKKKGKKKNKRKSVKGGRCASSKKKKQRTIFEYA